MAKHYISQIVTYRYEADSDIPDSGLGASSRCSETHMTPLRCLYPPRGPKSGPVCSQSAQEGRGRTRTVQVVVLGVTPI